MNQFSQSTYNNEPNYAYKRYAYKKHVCKDAYANVDNITYDDKHNPPNTIVIRNDYANTTLITKVKH